MTQNMVEHHAAVVVNAPVRQVYNLFTHFNDFPKFMSFVKEVTYYDEQRSHWVAEVAGTHEWDAVNEDWIPNQQIGWRAINGLDNYGRVVFQPIADQQTRLDVYINYDPPAGILGDIGERLGAGRRFDEVLQNDLDNFAKMVDMIPANADDPNWSQHIFHQDSAAARGTTTPRQNATMGGAFSSPEATGINGGDRSQLNSDVNNPAAVTGYPSTRDEQAYANADTAPSGYASTRDEQAFNNTNTPNPDYTSARDEQAYANADTAPSGYASTRDEQAFNNAPTAPDYPPVRDEQAFNNTNTPNPDYSSTRDEQAYANADTAPSGYTSTRDEQAFNNTNTPTPDYLVTRDGQAYANTDTTPSGYTSTRDEQTFNNAPTAPDYPPVRDEQAFNNTNTPNPDYTSTRDEQAYANADTAPSGYTSTRNEQTFNNTNTPNPDYTSTRDEQAYNNASSMPGYTPTSDNQPYNNAAPTPEYTPDDETTQKRPAQGYITASGVPVEAQPYAETRTDTPSDRPVLDQDIINEPLNTVPTSGENQNYPGNRRPAPQEYVRGNEANTPSEQIPPYRPDSDQPQR